MSDMKRSISSSAFAASAFLSAVLLAGVGHPVSAAGDLEAARSDYQNTPECIALALDGPEYAEFGGISFTPAQLDAYRAILADFERQFAAIGPPRTVVLADAPLAIDPHPATDDAKTEEIIAASDNLIRQGLSTAQQAALLTERFGQYATFSLAEATVWTPTQIAGGQQLGRDLEARTKEILTPQQRPVYQANLAMQRRIQACSNSQSPANRIISAPPAADPSF